MPEVCLGGGGGGDVEVSIWSAHCDNYLANDESELSLNRATWLFSSNWIHSLWSKHGPMTLNRQNFRITKSNCSSVRSCHFRTNFTCKTLQILLVGRSIRGIFYEVITDRSKGIPLRVQRKPFLCWNTAQSTFSTARFGPQMPHNFNFFRFLSEFLVIVAAFIWNAEVTFRLLAMMIHMQCVIFYSFVVLRKRPKVFNW